MVPFLASLGTPRSPFVLFSGGGGNAYPNYVLPLRSFLASAGMPRLPMDTFSECLGTAHSGLPIAPCVDSLGMLRLPVGPFLESLGIPVVFSCPFWEGAAMHMHIIGLGNSSFYPIPFGWGTKSIGIGPK